MDEHRQSDFVQTSECCPLKNPRHAVKWPIVRLKNVIDDRILGPLSCDFSPRFRVFSCGDFCSGASILGVQEITKKHSKTICLKIGPCLRDQFEVISDPWRGKIAGPSVGSSRRISGSGLLSAYGKRNVRSQKQLHFPARIFDPEHLPLVLTRPRNALYRWHNTHGLACCRRDR